MVMMPLPVLVNATLVALPFSIIPENVWLLVLPTVRVSVPEALLVTFPAPSSEPRVSLKPAKSKVAPEAMVIALELLILSDAPNFSVPALMVVAPVYPELPDNVQVPVPDFIRPDVPELMEPEKILPVDVPPNSNVKGLAPLKVPE